MKSFNDIKKAVFLIIVLCNSFHCLAQTEIRVCCRIDGIWNKWETYQLDGGFYGNYQGFFVFSESNKPWGAQLFSFKITDYVEPSDEVKKQHRKSKEWFKYKGIVEYWVSEDYPTVKDILSRFGRLLISSKPSDGSLSVKRTAQAEIWIQPYKKHPRVYNFFFDGVGFGIDLQFDRW